jgi:hypothetical protein
MALAIYSDDNFFARFSFLLVIPFYYADSVPATPPRIVNVEAIMPSIAP